MAERKILPVENNMDKAQTYRKNIDRYNRAIKGEFYFEALMIDYAMIEDRLRSIIYHMGFISNRETISIWKKTRPILESIVSDYKNPKENNVLGTKNISCKIKLIRCIFKWAEDDVLPDDKFQRTLKAQCNLIGSEETFAVFDAVTEWCKYRNEIVHALMNKNIESMQTEICEQAKKGMMLARKLDNIERKIKAGNKIRKSINLQNN